MCCAFLLIRGICPCRRRRDPIPDCAMAQHHVKNSMMRALVFKPAAQRAYPVRAAGCSGGVILTQAWHGAREARCVGECGHHYPSAVRSAGLLP